MARWKAPLAAGAALVLTSAGFPGLASAGEASLADGDNPWLWAAPALYGFEDGTCSGDAPSRQIEGSMIDPVYCPALGEEQRIDIGRAFAAAVSSNFSQVEAEFGAHLPDGATPSARLRSTLAVSLRLGRAGKALVRRPVGIDAYTPITLTLDITNPSSGEVVFTRSRTTIVEGTFATGDVDTQLLAQFPEHLRAAMLALVAQAGAEFKPYAQRAEVVGEVSLGGSQKGYVISKGRDAGLRRGDGIGGTGTIVQAGADYAIVTSALGSYQTGQVLSRTASAPVTALARPSVLVSVEEAPEGYAPEWLSQVLEGELGAGSALSPVPVNPAFSNLRRFALDGAGSNLDLDDRSLPDYVASVRLVLLGHVERPGRVRGVTVERHEALAFVTLVDASGRAVAAWEGRGLIRDEVKHGVRFPTEKRSDEVLRNALVDVASKMASFRPQPATLPISGSKGTFEIADAAGLLGAGTTVQVLHPVRGFSSVAGDVMVPIGMVTTRTASAKGIEAVDSGVQPLQLKGHDVVELESGGAPPDMRLAVGECPSPSGQSVDDRGQIGMPVYGSAAPSLIVGNMPAAIRPTSLAVHLARFAPSFAGWSTYAPAKRAHIDACFRPVIAIVPDTGGYQVSVGYTLHAGSDASTRPIGSGGLGVALTPTPLPPDTAPEFVAGRLQMDLVDQILPLAAKAATMLKPQG